MSGADSRDASRVTVEVEVEALDGNPWQPRGRLDESELVTLAESIRAQGLLQPIVVCQKREGRFTIVAGHRRVEAHRRLGRRSILAIVREQLTEAEFAAMAYAENVARAALSAVEEGATLQAMVDAGLARTNEELAALVQQPASRIKRLRRLMAGPRVIRDAVDGGCLIPLGHGDDGGDQRELRRLEFNSALAFIRLHDFFKTKSPKKADEKTENAVRRALAKNWSVRDCEAFVDEVLRGKREAPETSTAVALFSVRKRRFIVDLSLVASATAQQLEEVRTALDEMLQHTRDNVESNPA